MRPAVCERRQTDRQTDIIMENYSCKAGSFPSLHLESCIATGSTRAASFEFGWTPEWSSGTFCPVSLPSTVEVDPAGILKLINCSCSSDRPCNHYEFNFLGYILDANLNWKKHLGKISNQCSKKIGILNKLKHTLPQEIKLILYNSLIVPHINYCIMAWGFHSNRILKLQKKALRIITLSKYNSHSEPLYKKTRFPQSR